MCVLGTRLGPILLNKLAKCFVFNEHCSFKSALELLITNY